MGGRTWGETSSRVKDPKRRLPIKGKAETRGRVSAERTTKHHCSNHTQAGSITGTSGSEINYNPDD